MSVLQVSLIAWELASAPFLLPNKCAPSTQQREGSSSAALDGLMPIKRIPRTLDLSQLMGCALGAPAQLAARCPAPASFSPAKSVTTPRSLAAAGSMTRGRRGAAAAAARPEDVAAVLQRFQELPKAVVFDVSWEGKGICRGYGAGKKG